jgi:hypothetical protein
MDSPLTPALLDCINKILIDGDVPRGWKNNYITTIEKKPGKIDADTLADDLRPISIEYSKLVSNHEVVSPAQRAFLKNGSINQCITTILNVFEDARQKRRLHDSVLYMIAYDQAKAYDSVQIYSIRATLERFNLPDSFINYCVNMHTCIRASFKTFYGLTDSFNVEKNKAIR